MKLSEQSNLLSPSPMFHLLQRVHDMEAQGKKVYHLEIGDPCFDTPKGITDSAIKAMREGKTHYADSMGIPELRDAICEDTYKTHGFRPSRNQVVIMPANAIILFTLMCLVNKGDEVLYPDPSFTSFLSGIRLVGAKPVPYQLKERDAFRVDCLDVENKVDKKHDKTKLIILNSPSNPTGAVSANGDIDWIAKMAERRNLWILSDETYHKVIYPNDDGSPAKHWSPASWEEARDRTIILVSLSKAYAMTGFRLGYAIAPEKVAEKLGLMIQSTISCVSPFLQYAGVTALEKGECANRSMVSQLRLQRDFVVKALNDMGLPCKTPEGAFYAMPNIRSTGLSSQEFADKMLEGGVALLPGTDFGKYGEGYARISYAGKFEELEQAMNRMKVILNGEDGS